MKVSKGPHSGDYKCFHCKINKKVMPQVPEIQERVCACGCSHLKAVMELELIKREILGQVVSNDQAATQIRRSISYADWLKMEYIWGELIGFKANWLLDSTAMKAGLIATAEKM